MEGGSANDYDYCNGEPINCFDLDGRDTSGTSLGDTDIHSYWSVQYSGFQVPLRYGKNTGKGKYGYNYMRQKHGWHPTLMRLALTRGVVRVDRANVFRYTYYYDVHRGRCICAMGMRHTRRKKFTVIVDYNRTSANGDIIGIRNAYTGVDDFLSVR